MVDGRHCPKSLEPPLVDRMTKHIPNQGTAITVYDFPPCDPTSLDFLLG